MNKNLKFFTVVAFVLFFYQSHAQWTTDTNINTLVASSKSEDVQSVTSLDGDTYIVFWKKVSSSNNYELRMQVLDSEGHQKLGTDGILVSGSLPMSSYTMLSSVILDRDKNLYIAVVCTQDKSLRIFKMNSSGDFLWGEDGVIVNGKNFLTKLCPLSNGDLLLVWGVSEEAAKMQRYDSAGNEVWGTEKSIGDGRTSPDSVFELSDGSVVIIYHELSFGVSSILFSQRYDSNGESVWSSPLQLSDKSTAFNIFCSTLQIDDNVYVGYQAATGNRFDSFLQRINPDGTLPFGINGIDFDVRQNDYEMKPKIAATSNNFIWAVCQYTSVSQDQAGIYVQKFDVNTGERLLGDNAHEVYAISNDYYEHWGDLQIVGDRPIFLLELFDKLYAVLLDEVGDFVWEEHEKSIATFEASKICINFNSCINEQIVTIFVENKGGGQRIYAQNLTDIYVDIADVENNFPLILQNPFSERITLETDTPIKSIAIYDAKGILVYRNSYNKEQGVEINTDYWENGIYILKVSLHNNKMITRKIIKVKK